MWCSTMKFIYGSTSNFQPILASKNRIAHALSMIQITRITNNFLHKNNFLLISIKIAHKFFNLCAKFKYNFQQFLVITLWRSAFKNILSTISIWPEFKNISTSIFIRSAFENISSTIFIRLAF